MLLLAAVGGSCAPAYKHIHVTQRSHIDSHVTLHPSINEHRERAYLTDVQQRVLDGSTNQIHLVVAPQPQGPTTLGNPGRGDQAGIVLVGVSIDLSTSAFSSCSPVE